jgi:glutamate N-acetyltransferase/amino-acid N-acetyltransferase
VKAAVHGCDPNWGRIINAVGYSGVEVVESKVDVWLGEVQVMATGTPRNFDGEAARAVLGRDEVSIRVNLNLGQGEATAWGCDLSEEYVVINSAYTT